MINDIVAYLPNIFVAIIIIVIAGAIAAAVKGLVEVALGNPQGASERIEAQARKRQDQVKGASSNQGGATRQKLIG